jgi:hypothetical protein
MFLLHSRYFCNVHRDTFFRDMNGKDWVIILHDARDLVGFSTLQVLRLPVEGIERVFLFSGDTVVDLAHGQDSTLAGCFGHFMLRLMAENGGTPLYWFLISKGYRTYRFLPVYFKKFHPVHDRPTPPDYAALLQTVAAHKFGDAYNKHTGLIHLGGRNDRLRPEMCDIPESRRGDPHVRIFLEHNPEYAAGDELACLADISRENLNKYAWRVIEHTAVTWDE